MEHHGIKRKRSEELEAEQETSGTKYSRSASDKPQPRFDTSAMPVNAERTTENYERLEKLGEGTFGLWYKARDKETKLIVAMKRLTQHRNTWNAMDLRAANIGLALEHKHLRLVLDVVGKKTQEPSTSVVTKDQTVYLVAEYCDCVLCDLLQSSAHQYRQFSEKCIKSMVHQLLLAVEYMHKNNVMHRDIKPAKIYLKGGEIKLDTAGLVREYTTEGNPTPIVVTLWYRAPELLLGVKQYDTAIDMWSVGCIMAELFTCRPLFPGNSELDMLTKLVAVLGPVREHTWPELPALGPAASRLLQAPEASASLTHLIPHLSRTAHELLRGLLCYNPRHRLTARQALQHEWFNDLSPHALQYRGQSYRVELLEWC